MKRFITGLLLIMVSVAAHAELFSFYGITANDPSGTAATIGESQLSVDVTVLSPTTVSLSFGNVGSDDNAVSKICFDFLPEVNPDVVDITSSIPQAIWNIGMNMGANQLPGADGWFMSDICLTPKPPPTKKGVLTGSSLEVILSHDAGFDVLLALGNEDLRIGIHVISMGDDGLGGDYSESFINNIPEPSTALLLGFVALVGKSYRKIFVV